MENNVQLILGPLENVLLKTFVIKINFLACVIYFWLCLRVVT